MKPVVFLRIASVLTLIHAALHTIGGVFGKPAPGVAATTYAVMKANYFPALGAIRSYWEFYRGMGLAVSIFLTVEGIVFWQLASLAKNNAFRLRPVLALFLAGYVAMAVNSYFYFFSAPVVVEFLIAACLGMAMATAKTAESAGASRVVARQA
jgi:hypothetical protein